METHLRQLEAEAIYVLRETAAAFERPVLLFSAGKDSSVLCRLSQKAFYPGPIPYPLLHVDTGWKFPEMIAFRDRLASELGVRLLVERNQAALAGGAHPNTLGTDGCCARLKTEALRTALVKYRFDAPIGGARREEEKSRAKERVFSVRDAHGQWDPRQQRPEPWHLVNFRLCEGQSMRVFPLSNWTELDIWQYIQHEGIAVVPLYYARVRQVVTRKGALVMADSGSASSPETRSLSCRFRTLGCIPCTGAVASEAATLDAIVAEVAAARTTEREYRLIDFTSESSMEQKKREGYF